MYYIMYVRLIECLESNRSNLKFHFLQLTLLYYIFYHLKLPLKISFYSRPSSVIIWFSVFFGEL